LKVDCIRGFALIDLVISVALLAMALGILNPGQPMSRSAVRPRGNRRKNVKPTLELASIPYLELPTCATRARSSIPYDDREKTRRPALRILACAALGGLATATAKRWNVEGISPLLRLFCLQHSFAVRGVARDVAACS